MNKVPKETRDNIDLVAKFYGLSPMNKTVMLDDALHKPVVGETYAAIVRSFSVEELQGAKK